jgi:cell division protein FtsB
MAWRMSQQQQDNLAWIMRGLTVLGLSLATWLGAKVYDKVDSMYWLVKVHEEQIIELKKESERKEKEMERIKTDYAILRENYFEIKSRLAEMERH